MADEEFDRFWRAYPRKIAKGDARKAWKQTEKIRPGIDKVIEKLADWAAYRARLQTMEKFCPDVCYPATWLRGERWDDEFETAKEIAKQGEPAWYETVSGIADMGLRFGMSWGGDPNTETFVQFAERVRQKYSENTH